MRENFDLEHRVRELTKRLDSHSVRGAEESQSQPPLEVTLQHRLDAAQKHIASLQKVAIDSYEEHHIETQALRSRIHELENGILLSKQARKPPSHIEQASSNDIQIIKSDYEQRLEEKNIVIAELKRRLVAHTPGSSSGTKDNPLASALPDGTR